MGDVESYSIDPLRIDKEPSSVPARLEITWRGKTTLDMIRQGADSIIESKRRTGKVPDFILLDVNFLEALLSFCNHQLPPGGAIPLTGLEFCGVPVLFSNKYHGPPLPICNDVKTMLRSGS